MAGLLAYSLSERLPVLSSEALAKEDLSEALAKEDLSEALAKEDLSEALAKEDLSEALAKEDLSEAFFNHRSFSTGDGEGVRQWQGCSEKYRDHSSGYCPGF